MVGDRFADSEEDWLKAMSSKSDAIKDLLTITRRIGLLSLTDMREAVTDMRRRAREAGFKLPKAGPGPKGVAAMQAANKKKNQKRKEKAERLQRKLKRSK